MTDLPKSLNRTEFYKGCCFQMETDDVVDGGKDNSAVLMSEASGNDHLSVMASGSPWTTAPTVEPPSFLGGLNETCAFAWFRKLFHQTKHKTDKQ